MKTSLQNSGLKVSQMKEIIKESLEEKREMFYDLMYEVMEDICLANAIKKGEKIKTVKRETVFKILDGHK